MNIFITKAGWRISFVKAGLAGLLILGGSSAHSQESEPSKAKVPGDELTETLRFWQNLENATAPGKGIEVLQFPTWQGPIAGEVQLSAIRDIVNAERRRSGSIISQPVLHVNPDLAAFGAQFARTHNEIANVLEEFVKLNERKAEMTSGAALGAGLFLNLMAHRNDREDGILWRALLDEGRQTAQNLRTLNEPALNLEQRFASVRRQLQELEASEMETRIKLAARFDREFPLLKEKGEATQGRAPAGPKFPAKLIVNTLQGKRVGSPFNNWTFESPDEIKTLDIQKMTRPEKLRIDFVARLHLRGIRSATERDMDLHLTYGWFYTRWVLVGVEQI